MHDLIFLGVFAVMMAAAFGYVRACNRIVGDVEAPTSERRP